MTDDGPHHRGTTVRGRLADFWDGSRSYYRQAAEANVELSEERRRLIARLEGSERVLDLGSGSCENAQWLPTDCRYVGLDLSTIALAMAAEQERPGLRVRGDAGLLPFADGSFDAVLSTWVLEHLHDPAATFVEVARVLRPGGLLLLVGSAWDLPWETPPSVSDGSRALRTALRLGRQLDAAVAGHHRFEMVREPRVLSEDYVPDSDAVFVVQSWLLARYLDAVGFDIEEHDTLAHGSDPAGARGWLRRLLRRAPVWRYGWGNVLLVGRRRTSTAVPESRRLYL